MDDLWLDDNGCASAETGPVGIWVVSRRVGRGRLPIRRRGRLSVLGRGRLSVLEPGRLSVLGRGGLSSLGLYKRRVVASRRLTVAWRRWLRHH